MRNIFFISKKRVNDTSETHNNERFHGPKAVVEFKNGRGDRFGVTLVATQCLQSSFTDNARVASPDLPYVWMPTPRAYS